MAFLGFKAYPTPIWKPLGPFIVASGIVFWGVNALQNSMVKSGENAKDPRNPYGQKVHKESHH
ncbi:putative ATP18-subunit I/j of the mitochondrial F1F0-ATP synthase [Tilletiaria anomala UBC 951]|uniref:Putative ATP18-subunit I/j of the mitochondrial F1F0-ATP synthase n=1 Tax=Tilletiaria anomala (strain ATCC 24038 / CBS 436.72 / UBC 951) TaxID=1037660 RepID=A0A066W3S2_TILAU|nr:putative ATP18-subunit I/j of the mitochondrial F1F0-ATP synthase [Tilletiaria anomala UBC 951]KDN45739.1 putative ATP18-subunit I/j of the mitochondrial F1F0-ATP synthase [Tilletiaria anomala UBC 951]